MASSTLLMIFVNIFALLEYEKLYTVIPIVFIFMKSMIGLGLGPLLWHILTDIT